MGPLLAPAVEAPAAAMVADTHSDQPQANVEMFGADRQAGPFLSTGYFPGEFSSEVMFGEGDATFAPPSYATVVVIELQPTGWSDAETPQGDPQPREPSPVTNLQPSVHTDANAGDASASREASQDAKTAPTYVAAPIVGYSNVQATFDFDSAYIKPSIDLTLEAVRATRPDTNDPGKQAPAGLLQRLQPTATITSDADHHANGSYQQAGGANNAGVQVLGKPPAEALARLDGPARLDGGAALDRPISQGGEPETVERVFDAALNGFGNLVEDGPQAAVALRPAMTLAAEVQGQLLEASSEFFDSELSWASVAPLLPQFSPEAMQLGQAFDAVLADLDELGGELFSSFTDSDRLLWGAGACGVVSYVAARHFHLRPATQNPGLRRGRESIRATSRRMQLSVQRLAR